MKELNVMQLEEITGGDGISWGCWVAMASMGIAIGASTAFTGGMAAFLWMQAGLYAGSVGMIAGCP